MERVKTFHTTTHGTNRVFERALSLDAMKNVVNYHDTKRQQYRGTNGGFVYRFQKKVDGKVLVVIAEVKKSEAWVDDGMKIRTNIISVKSSTPPVVEIDTEMHSAYVRFSKNRIAKTVSRDDGPGPVITIDLDQNGNVVGVELLGVDEFGIRQLLLKAPITVEPKLLDQARYIAAKKGRAMAAA